MTSAAYDRLAAGYYNLDLRSPTNPGGMSGVGAPRVNWSPFLADFTAVAGEVIVYADQAAAAAEASLGGPNTCGSSTTSVELPEAGQTMTIEIEAGKSIVAGVNGVIARPAPNAATHAAYGVVQSYDPETGELVLLAADVVGSGEFDAWNFALSGYGVPRVRSVTGGGLATGGGDFTDDRIITVTAAAKEDIWAGAADDLVVTPSVLYEAVEPVALVDAATVTPNFGAGLDFTWTVGAAGRTLGNPANAKVGMTGSITITNGASYLIAYGSAWKRSGGAGGIAGGGAITELEFKVKAVDGSGNATRVHYDVSRNPTS